MAWYTICFIVVFSIFIIKLFLSLSIGDFGLDIDANGIDDVDVSSVFSFKGILHFLTGSLSYLFLRSNMVTITKINGVAQFTIFDYFIAAICGICLVIILYYGYKFAIKAESLSKSPEDLINNSYGTVYLNLGNGNYSVEVHTLSGTINVLASYDNTNLVTGTKVKIVRKNNRNFIELIN